MINGENQLIQGIVPYNFHIRTLYVYIIKNENKSSMESNFMHPLTGSLPHPIHQKLVTTRTTRYYAELSSRALRQPVTTGATRHYVKLSLRAPRRLVAAKLSSRAAARWLRVSREKSGSEKDTSRSVAGALSQPTLPGIRDLFVV